MKGLFFISVLLLVFNANAQQDSMVFYSSKELNQYRFVNTDLNAVTTGYLLDMEEEMDSDQMDTLIKILQNGKSNFDGLLSILNLIERTDVNYQFERDSILFPILDEYMYNDFDRELRIPLIITDIDFSRLNPEKGITVENWANEEPYPQFNQSDLHLLNLTYVALLADSLNHDLLRIYWDEKTVISNTERIIAKVKIKLNEKWIEIESGVDFDIMPYVLLNDLSSVDFQVTFSDSITKEWTSNIHLTKSKNDEILARSNFGDYRGIIRGHDHHDLLFTILYGCEDGRLNKPFIMVAGWGPYVGKNFINNEQGWPSDENNLYHLWNQAGFIDNLRQVGYDVIITRFLPPNADIRKNVQKLEKLINWVNHEKELNNSYEENIILGYSAGAMAVRLTLQTMEHRHLNFEGPHPHTKLYISFDGEHQGANIPLATQHTVKYMNDYLYPAYNTHVLNNLITNTGYTMYTLHYILNAPLSKQLLKYFHTETGKQNNPAQGEHPLRTEYMWEYSYHNHSKNSHLPGYPSFSRNISISNGMSESNINGTISSHHPFPSQEGFTPFRQVLLRRKWNSWFNKSQGNLVFQYQWRTLFNGWKVKMEAATNWDCLVLDNAPGGTVFIPKGQNPLYSVVNVLRQAIAFSEYNPSPPQDYRPHTQFSFTPTLLTHDIRNFDPSSKGYRMDYSLKQNDLMFQHINHVGYIDSSNNYWGYPHLAYPHSHYWEVTPFDALFTWNENTEHILFNRAVRNDPDNYLIPWERLYSNTSNVVKNFMMDEADYFNAFIQNKRYGWNARDNYVYKADIIVPNVIMVGQEVTQRTNFKPVEFLSNSDLYLQAGKEIVFYPGTEINAGATFHAVIAPYHCGFSGMTTGGNNMNNHASSELISISTEHVEIEKEEIIPYIIYPNPSSGEVNIQNLQPEKVAFEYIIYDINGNELTRGESHEIVTTFRVVTGMYIVKLRNHEKSYSYKVIVR